MSDEPKQKFHQFPIGLLACGSDKKEKMNLIIAYATITAGVHRERAMGGGGNAVQYLEERIDSKDFKSGRWDHRAWALGKEVVSYSWHDTPKFCVDTYDRAMTLLLSFPKSPQVRVSKDLIEDVDKGNFEFRDFAVLCGVYAVIGDKQYAIVRRDRVRAGALGYSSGKVLFNENGELTTAGKSLLKQREDKSVPLTLNQCRHTLNRLHARKFFSRLQPGKCGRTVYYSRSLDHDALAGLLIGRIEKRVSASTAQDAAQILFRDKAASLLKRLIGGDSKEGEKSPGIHRTITGGVTVEPTAPVTGEVTALILSSSNVFSGNSCPANECSGNAAARALNEGDSESAAKDPEPVAPTIEALRSLEAKPTTTAWPPGMFTKLTLEAIDNPKP